jgi:PucR C-terminal helix-turn-helix domain
MPDQDRTSATLVVTDHKVLAAIVDRVDPAEVAREMVERFRHEIAGYRRLPDSVLGGQIFEVSRRNVELFFRSLSEGAEPSEAELAAFRESARNRAAEGMPLEDLLHAYRLGGRLGWRAIAAAAEGPVEQQALLAGAELLMRYVDQVSAAVAQTYLDERQHLVSEEERRLRDLAEALVGDRPLSNSLKEAAGRIGFPLEDSYRAVVQTVPGAPAYTHGQVAAALRLRGVLALTEGDRVAGLAPAGLEPATLVTDGALVAVGEPAPLDALGDELDDMRVLVELGRRSGRVGLLRPDEFVPELLLARSPSVARLATRRALEPIEGNADLARTLRTYVESGLDRRRAAAELHVHPNTLDYRLQKIAQLTGLELGRPGDLAIVVLALKQRALLAH